MHACIRVRRMVNDDVLFGACDVRVRSNLKKKCMTMFTLLVEPYPHSRSNDRTLCVLCAGHKRCNML